LKKIDEKVAKIFTYLEKYDEKLDHLWLRKKSYYQQLTADKTFLVWSQNGKSTIFREELNAKEREIRKLKAQIS